MKNSKIFDFAYLSVASYAELSELIGTSIESREEFIREAIEKYSNYSSSDSTSTFAEIVTENYEVVAHWQDRGSFWDLKNYIPLVDSNKNKSGFSATLFKIKENGEYTLAFRGTLGGRDLVITDGADVVFDGIAHEQVVDLYNFWVQLNTPKDQIYEAAYFREVSPIEIVNINQPDRIVKLDGKFYFIDFKDSDKLYASDTGYTHGLGVFPSKEDKINITGHSLGGHLATVFTQLFPNVVKDAYTFNGAGLGRNTSLFAFGSESNYYKILNTLASKHNVSFEETEIVYNIIGDKGLDFVANDWFIGLKQPNNFESFIESLRDIVGHGMASMAETMAVASLFASLDNSLDNMPTKDYFENFVNPLLRATSANDNKTLEIILDKLSLLLTGKGSSIKIDDREEFYQVVKNLQEIIVGKDGKEGFVGKLQIKLIDDSIARLALQDNSEGLAARYALKYLNPFIAFSDSFYIQENLFSNELPNLRLFDIHDESTINGMSENFILYRSQYLLDILEKNRLSSMAETAVSTKSDYHDLTKAGDQWLTTYADDGSIKGTKPLVVFGSENSDNQEYELAYTKRFIFSGAGEDVLYAGTNYSYLEGGKGFDQYIIRGKTDILDSDGAGKLLFGSLTGNTPNAFVLVDAVAGIWRSIGADKAFDGLFTAYREAADLIVKENASGHLARILGYFERVKDVYKEDFLGLHLFDDIETLKGNASLQVFNGNDNFHNVISVGKESYAIYSGAKNDIVFGQAATLGADGFALKAQLGTGDDVAYGSLARDRIEGGNGIDLINGSAFMAVKNDKRSQADRALDSDVLVGNEGSDFINGFAGDDVIHAGNVGDHELKEASDAQGDFVTGGDGNDSIYGSAAKDVLQGGEGSDVVHGGANDDLILGDSFIRMSPNFQRITFDGSPTTYEHRVDLVTGQWKSTSYAASNRLPPDEAKWVWEKTADGKDYVLKRAKGGFNNNEHIVENGGDDYLYGGSGNDFIVGQTGNDVLHGQDGDDTIFGDDTRIELSGDDHLIGGKGNDTLIGGKGQDSYYFNQEDLVAADGRSFVDTLIDDGKENYTGKADVIYLDGKAAHEMRWRYDEQKQLWLNDNNLWRIRQIGESLVIRYGQDGGAIEVKDYAVGDYGLDLTLPKAEEDNSPPPSEPTSPNHPTQDAPRPTPKTEHPPAFVQTGGDGDDLLLTGSNSIEDGSLFQEDWGSMSVEYSEEAVLLDGGAGNDYLSTGKGNDRLYGGEGKDRLFAYGGDDELQGGSGDDLLAGGDDSDKLFGEAGNDRLVGQAGDDFLDGGDGVDILAGGSGKDWLYGGMGEDVYLYRQQDGQDYLHDSGGEDTLFLPDITADLFNGHIQRQGDDLLLSLDAENQLGIKGFFHAEYAIEYIAFADGSHIHAAALYQQFNQAYQGSQAVYDHSRTLGVYQPVAELL